MNHAYSITAAELATRGRDDIPPELLSSAHLIYSSPATLAFNSPGAQGFGVKRAGLAVPGSVMLLVAPACCGRNTAALGCEASLAERFFYLMQDDTDIVTGRHLARIPEAVKEVCDSCAERPSAVMICITCVDALLGTDMERVCRKASDYAGVPVVPCYMYALTREGRLPPMVSVRRSVYSLLQPREKVPTSVNILGFFSPLRDDAELYTLLRSAGVRAIREISRCADYEEYRKMAEANFNLVLNQEARHAAADLQKRLGIPSVELARLYRTDKIANQYRLLGQAVGAEFDDTPYRERAEQAIADFRDTFGRRTFAVGECLNADPFELSLALIGSGFAVSEIFGTVGGSNFVYVKKIAALSPATKIYSNLSPSMMFYDGKDAACDTVIGRDAMYYHPNLPGVPWNDERQPFGYAGVAALFGELAHALSAKEAAR